MAELQRVVYQGPNSRFASEPGIVYDDPKEKVLCFVPIAERLLPRPFTVEELMQARELNKLRLPAGTANCEPYLR